jgi:hypothetical protein
MISRPVAADGGGDDVRLFASANGSKGVRKSNDAGEELCRYVRALP